MTSTGAWLEQNLTRRGGGQELPYQNDVKWTIRQHLLDFVAAFTSIVLKVKNYTHTNGTCIPLFVAEGTLPMFYQGIKYNIPVAIWLPEGYPKVAPIVYVMPTHDMMIKPKHGFVTMTGQVLSEYLRQWKFPSSNLEVLGHDTSIQFAQEPPLFQKPANMVSPQASPQRPPAASTAQHSSFSHSTFSNPINSSSDPYASNFGGVSAAAMDAASLWGPAVSAAQTPQPRPRQTPPLAPSKPSPPPDLQAIFKKVAVKTLSERLTAAITAANQDAASETDQLFEEQAELGGRKQAIDKGVEAVQRWETSLTAQAERSALETCVLELAGKRVALERWLTENESKMPQGEVDADAAIVAADVLSNQALSAQAEDLALEDALYCLDKALQDSILPSDAYMKQVRSLCHKQFFVRALGAKVAQKQHELKRNAIASRQQQQHVQMPQGDYWTTGILANPLTARD